MVVRYPLACRSLAKDAAMIPLPKDEVTPPVTKMYLVCDILQLLLRGAKVQIAAQKSGGLFGKFFLELSDDGFQVVVLDGEHGLQEVAQLPFGKSFLTEPHQIRQGPIHQITSLVLAIGHLVMRQFQKLLSIGPYFHL